MCCCCCCCMLKSSFSLCVFSISISISVCICLLLCFRLSTVFGKRLSHCHCCFIYLTVLVMPRSCVKKFAIRKCALASRSVCFFQLSCVGFLVVFHCMFFPLHCHSVDTRKINPNNPEPTLTLSPSLFLSICCFCFCALFLCAIKLFTFLHSYLPV